MYISTEQTFSHSYMEMQFLSMNININHPDEKMQKRHAYIEGLEEERRKIMVFQRELPLCLELITQAIDAFRQQLAGTTKDSYLGGSQTSTDGPVLDECIPMKTRTTSDEHEQHSHDKPNNNLSISNNNNNCDWLRYVELWNHTPAHDTPIKKSNVDGGGTFHPFKGERSCEIAPKLMGNSPSSAMSSEERSGDGGGDRTKSEERGGRSKGKARRRCWSPELHRRFLDALQRLGGAHVATPKQITELMKVDGLTTDEVKSHLQKYRLHTRRSSPSIHNNQQAPQFLVVGGIWVPPPKFTSVATTKSSGQVTGAAISNGIYAPIAATPPLPFPQTLASLPPVQQHKVSKKWQSDEMGSRSDDKVMQSKQLHLHERGCHSTDGAYSNSSATSSSTHTTTTSPMF